MSRRSPPTATRRARRGLVIGPSDGGTDVNVVLSRTVPKEMPSSGRDGRRFGRPTIAPLPSGRGLVGETRENRLQRVLLALQGMAHLRILGPGDLSGRFADAARAGLLLRGILDDLGVTSYPKTSGSRGLHVLVPLRPGPSQDEVRGFAMRVGRLMAARGASPTSHAARSGCLDFDRPADRLR
jgi:hypothetical protein